MWHHQIRLHKFWRRVLDNHVTISYKIPVILQVKLQDTFFHFFLVTWDPALFQNWLLKGETSLKPQSNPDSSLGAKIHGSFFHHLKYPSKCSYSIYCNHIRLHLVKSPLFKFKLHMSGKTLHLCNWAHTKSQDTGWPNANLPNAPPLHPELHMDNPFKIFKRLSELAAFCHLKILA